MATRDEVNQCSLETIDELHIVFNIMEETDVIVIEDWCGEKWSLLTTEKKLLERRYKFIVCLMIFHAQLMKCSLYPPFNRYVE